ncbi:hypothetical protein HZB88_00430 [archaeon]|nr:hypothetical protein [archaeon]
MEGTQPAQRFITDLAKIKELAAGYREGNNNLEAILVNIDAEMPLDIKLIFELLNTFECSLKTYKHHIDKVGLVAEAFDLYSDFKNNILKTTETAICKLEEQFHNKIKIKNKNRMENTVSNYKLVSNLYELVSSKSPPTARLYSYIQFSGEREKLVDKFLGFNFYNINSKQELKQIKEGIKFLRRELKNLPYKYCALPRFPFACKEGVEQLKEGLKKVKRYKKKFAEISELKKALLADIQFLEFELKIGTFISEPFAKLEEDKERFFEYKEFLDLKYFLELFGVYKDANTAHLDCKRKEYETRLLDLLNFNLINLDNATDLFAEKKELIESLESDKMIKTFGLIKRLNEVKDNLKREEKKYIGYAAIKDAIRKDCKALEEAIKDDERIVLINTKYDMSQDIELLQPFIKQYKEIFILYLKHMDEKKTQDDIAYQKQVLEKEREYLKCIIENDAGKKTYNFFEVLRVLEPPTFITFQIKEAFENALTREGLNEAFLKTKDLVSKITKSNNTKEFAFVKGFYNALKLDIETGGYVKGLLGNGLNELVINSTLSDLKNYIEFKPNLNKIYKEEFTIL